MAIEAFTGLMGDGKTYEVVKSVVVPAIARGQRVVTNIRGLNPEVIAQHLGIPAFRVSALIKEFHIEESQSANFYPSEGKEDGVLEWGAYNIIDEAHFVYGTGTKFDDRAKYFIRQHRHETVDEKSTQIVLITQTVDDLTSYVKSVVQVTTRCIKQRINGRSKSYWCRKFNGPTEAPAKRISEHSYSYVKPFVDMYSSQRGAIASEKGVDDRLNIWRSPKMLLAYSVIAGSSLIFLWLVIFGKHVLLKATGGKDFDQKAASSQQVQASKKCETPVVFVQSPPAGMRLFFVMSAGRLVQVPPGSVSGSPFRQVSSWCASSAPLTLPKMEGMSM